MIVYRLKDDDEEDDLYRRPIMSRSIFLSDDEEDYDNGTDLESIDNSEKSYFHDLESYWIQECAYVNMDTSISLPSDLNHQDRIKKNGLTPFKRRHRYFVTEKYFVRLLKTVEQ